MRIKTIVGLGILLVLYFLLQYLVVPNVHSDDINNKPHTIGRIIGRSMEPTFRDNDNIEVDSSYYLQNDIHRNDVVAIRFKTRDVPFVKRVIALPYDAIEFDDGSLWIHEYPDSKFMFDMDEAKMLLTQLEYYDYQIPQNHYLILGDNQAVSIDSKMFGLISKEQIIGKVKNPSDYYN